MFYILDHFRGFDLLNGRFASWKGHNILGKERERTIKYVLDQFLDSGFLQNPPAGYKERDPIYFAVDYVFRGIRGVLALLLAADHPKRDQKRIMLLAI